MIATRRQCLTGKKLTGDHFDDVVPCIQPTPGPRGFELIAPPTPVDVKLGLVRLFTYLWRPNHAIQRADTDGNAATCPDAT